MQDGRVPAIAILGGAGGVGASTAFSLLRRSEELDVIVVDRRPEKVRSHVMDLEQVVASRGGTVRAGSVEDAAAADVVVVCASVPLTANSSRQVYLSDNARILAAILERLEGFEGTLLMVSNPVDALLTWAHRRGGLARERLLGYTLNDSLRMRTAVAGILGVRPETVDATVLGEHGDAIVPLFGRLRVNGGPAMLDPEQRASAQEFVRSWYARHVSLDPRRSSTWTSGDGVAAMAAALGRGPELTLPACAVADGEYGIDGVALTLPVTIGPGGLQAVRKLKLEPDELDALRAAAARIAAAAARVEV